MRRTALVVGFVVLVAVAATVSPAVAQPTASAPSDVAADLNHDGVADLAVEVPGENGVAGAVSVLPGSPGGLTSTGGRLFTQNSPGVPGIAETFDQFGGLEIVF